MTFRYSVEVAAEPQALFDLTQDYPRRLDWDPFLREARLIGGAERADLGVRAWCAAGNGMGMETRYVTFEPPRVCAVEMTCGPWLIRSFAGSWRFDRLGPGRSRVTFTYCFIGRPRLLTRLLGVVFARQTCRRLAALKKVVESVATTPGASGKD